MRQVALGRFVCLRAILLIVLVAPAIVYGQAAASASISGRVIDDTGAPVPGVAVTVTSPALQVPAVAASTDNDGSYQLVELPAPGVYKASFAHSGFQTFVRGDLNLSVGFAARVDVTMKVGQVE